ncbi:hypothetical protein, partial [Paenibacillus sp. Y412MC10]|uniref:hypothetical protein n=1 Tax=Geobacillus sp. (strain Y412MC10) TaxID=481743 RepID=UPI0011A2E341
MGDFEVEGVEDWNMRLEKRVKEVMEEIMFDEGLVLEGRGRRSGRFDDKRESAGEEKNRRR